MSSWSFGQRVIKNQTRTVNTGSQVSDATYAPKLKTPPSAAVGSAAVGVEWIPDQPPHPKPKAHSPIQGESEVERPQAAR